jgi:hypothetical protein
MAVAKRTKRKGVVIMSEQNRWWRTGFGSRLVIISQMGVC